MTPRKRVAILGGGASALTVAYELTNAADWREHFDITVYQQGWRLGGKGASGRGEHGRIEEHGLHVWMGWYANAFRMIRAVYGELGRPPGAPLAKWDDAFKRHGFINLGEQVDGTWTNWPLTFPITDDTPGLGEGVYPSLWDYVHETLAALHRLLEGTLCANTPRHHFDKGLLGDVERLVDAVRHWLSMGDELLDIVAVELLLREARDRAATLRQAGTSEEDHDPIVQLMHRIRARLIAHIEANLSRDDEARRLFYIIDVGLSCVAGVLGSKVGLGPHSLDKLDTLDFRAFLAQWGAQPTSVNSSLVRAFYDLMLAYRDADPNDQAFAAGAALRFIFRMVMTYKGAIFWKMQAGMGDTIFTPLHDVLKARGVRFEFFHRVQRLELSDDKRSVERIHVGRQATARSGAYEPCKVVNNLRCWPNAPLYDQLVEGDELRAQGVDVESFWTPWQQREVPVVLKKGTDFDIVVFGISVGSLPFVAAELVAASANWRACVDAVETVRTQAMQLWMKPDLNGLGWTQGSAITDTYPEPMDTWADMSHLIPRETWPPDRRPRNITYFCAPLRGGIPPLSDTDAPARAEAEVKAAGIDWLQRYATIMWPKVASPPGSASGFDWRVLVGPDEQEGVARFDSQFWRANIDPSERYVLSVPGSTSKRLHANQPDFDNLFVTGDWTYSAINSGCVESAVMSGQLTANAICGVPRIEDIIGYNNP